MDIFLNKIGRVLLLSFLLSITFISTAATVKLKLLVISSGTPEQDSGLDYIDDVLNEMGVPYDVLDASKDTLTQDMLVTNNVGNYNGVILTDTYMYYLGEGHYKNSALTLEEWKILHQYERDFDVRESVLAGDPGSGEYYRENYDIDYGMDPTTSSTGTSFSGQWQDVVGKGEFYEYVNKENLIAITDFALASTPSGDPKGPVVLPLLKDSVTDKVLISELTYSDGRKVLLSTISNASYLLYSQIFNYEFINYASQGVFIGSRQIHLSAHVDDLFAADELWDPETNKNHVTNEYRNSAESIYDIVLSQYLFNQENDNFSNFKLDLAFNAGYAQLPISEKSSLASIKDTYISSSTRNKNRSNRSIAKVKQSWFKKHRALFGFDIKKSTQANSAILKLYTKKNWFNYYFRSKGKICLLDNTWDDKATWLTTNGNTRWENNGGDYLATPCVNYKGNWGDITADITKLVQFWQANKSEDFGLILVGKNGFTTNIYTNEASQKLRPQLDIEYYSSKDELVTAIIDTKDDFRFLNHTLTHRDMYTSSGATYGVARYEIEENLNIWKKLGLPDFERASQVLVTGNHSGLEDTISSNIEAPVYIPYPQGRNLDLLDVVEDLGIKYLASDSSRVNQNKEHYIENTNVLLLPRYPTNVFYNVTTPANMTDEYNYIYHDSFVEKGIDPCVDLAAICKPLTYQGILDYEADATVRHMLTYKAWPHYFHISNLKNYKDGNSLQFDWLKAVAKEYNKYINLPVKNLDYYTIGKNTEEKLVLKTANVKGTWDRENNTISLSANSLVNARITGAKGGEFYGGQNILKAFIDTSETIFTVDRALKE